jgi:hypothetical protein
MKTAFYLLYQIVDLIACFPFLALINIILYLVYILLIIFYSKNINIDLSFLVKDWILTILITIIYLVIVF